MISSTFGPSLSRRDTAKSSMGHESTLGSIPPPLSGGGTFGPQSAGAIYQHIHDMATKRISTLDYLRKASVSPWGYSQPSNCAGFGRTDKLYV